MREPSIHITKSKLKEFLKTCIKDIRNYRDTDEVVDQLMIMAKPHSISSRNMKITNKRLEVKATKLLESDTLDSNLFAKLLFMVRKKLRHKGIAPIKPGSREWDMVKEVTGLANQFCEEFELNKKEGYHCYIELSSNRLNGKFMLNKFNSIYQDVCDTYSAIKELKNDINPTLTENIYQFYKQIILERTGSIVYDYKKDPSKYIYFYFVANKCRQNNINYKVYIKAQFEGLAFVSGIPTPASLVGDKSDERLTKYMFENNIKAKTTETNGKIDWNKIRNA